jgi:myosin heavy subunit
VSQDSANASKVGRKGGGSASKSLSATFRADLASLMDAISAADPHFVRALNPNAQVQV